MISLAARVVAPREEMMEVANTYVPITITLLIDSASPDCNRKHAIDAKRSFRILPEICYKECTICRPLLPFSRHPGSQYSCLRGCQMRNTLPRRDRSAAL